MSCNTKTEQKADEKDNNEGGKKDSVTVQNVHSANSWETANLGDDDRKKKFLRLMGAGKKEHHGKIVIGDHESSHGRSENETKKVDEALEEQFKQGLEHKLVGGFKGHMGLGFHDDSVTEKTESSTKERETTASETTEKERTASEEEEISENKKEKSQQKHKPEEDTDKSNGSPTAAKKMKMNFVKASS